MVIENDDPPLLGGKPAPSTLKKPEMTQDGRIGALHMMLTGAQDCLFPHGEMIKYSAKLGVARSIYGDYGMGFTRHVRVVEF